MQCSAVHTLGHGKLSSAARADGAGLESVELLPAFSALPKLANRWRRLAVGAGESFPTGQLCKLDQRLRVLQAAPATHQHEESDRSQQDVSAPEGKTDESGDSDQANDRGDHQAARAAQHKPDQGAEYLAAIQRVD